MGLIKKYIYSLYLLTIKYAYKPIGRLKANKYSKKNTELKVEIGSGPKKGSNGWITLDLNPKADILWDLSNGLPFNNNSVSFIYSSHVMEHFSYKELHKLIEECYRILRPNGIFSACVPNARLYIDSYYKKSNISEELLRYKPAIASELPIDRINYIAYMDGHHKYMFDEENLQHLLKVHKFKEVQLRAFDSTLDLKERAYESLFVKGTK